VTEDTAPAGARLRPVGPADRPALAAIIRRVMSEFGAGGTGFSIHDPEVDAIDRAYAGPRAAYFVVEEDGVVLGGAGIAPLAGADAETCELRKMYLLPAARGRGLGARLLERCLAAARERGFARCYLETFHTMADARALYESFGFIALAGPLGATGHFGCDAWLVRELGPDSRRG